jgi:hypothetical protein
MKTTKTLLAALVAAVLATPAPAANLLAPGPADLVGLRTVALPAPAGAIERKPVAFGWALDPAAEVATPAPYVAQSRDWWNEVDAAQLRQGLAIDTSAPGAVLRLSPIGKAASPASLQLLRDGKALPDATAFAHRADDRQLQAAGMEVGNGSVVVQVAPDLGAGRFTVRVAGAQGRYLLHVYEPNSDAVLVAAAGRQNVLAGQALAVGARLERGGKAQAGAQLGGMLVSPSGRTVPLAFAGGRAIARVPVDAASEPGLWEAQVFAEGSDGARRLQRDGRTAFAVAQPTAKLAGTYAFDRAGFAFALPLAVGSPGRYEVTGTLFATGSDGVSRPVAQAASAAWLEPGARQLSLAFDRTHVPLGYGAPYELRQLQLKDQARMGMLETREFAARVVAVAQRGD